MNPYFVLLIIFNYVSSLISYSNLIKGGLSIFKYIKLIGSLLTPDPKGNVEYLRGGLVKISFIDPSIQSNFSDIGYSKQKESHILLAYSPIPKNWTHVFAVTKDEYDTVLESKFNQAKPLDSSTSRVEELEEIPNINNKDDMTDILKDLNDVMEKSVNNSIKEVKPRHIIKDCKKIDVTSLIYEKSGPGKDFFGSPVKTRHIDSSYKYLIFKYEGNKTKTFESDDVIVP